MSEKKELFKSKRWTDDYIKMVFNYTFVNMYDKQYNL